MSIFLSGLIGYVAGFISTGLIQTLQYLGFWILGVLIVVLIFCGKD